MVLGSGRAGTTNLGSALQLANGEARSRAVGLEDGDGYLDGEKRRLRIWMYSISRGNS